MKVRTTDGWMLDVDHRPREDARGAILMLHAMMVDRRSMRRLAAFLHEAGFEIFLADFRGHGASGPAPKQGGAWDYDDLVWCDIPALVRACRGESDRFLWLMGHSLGGHTGAAAATCGACVSPPDGLVLLSTNTWMPSLEPSLRRRLRKRLNMRLFQVFARVAGRFPSRRVGMGPADEALAYVEDLAAFYLEDRWGSRGGRDYLGGLHRFEGPVLSVIGRGDALMAHHVGARNWLTHFSDAEFWLAERGTHGLDFDPDHMTLVTQERARPVWEDMARWMADRS